MMNWYETRTGGRIQHRGQVIPGGAKLYLSDAQKDLYNRGEEKVVECEAPESSDGVAVSDDWNIYQLEITASPDTADEDVKEMPKAEDAGREPASRPRVVRAADTTDGNSTDGSKKNKR